MDKVYSLKMQLTKWFFTVYFVILAVLLIVGSYPEAYGLTFGILIATLNFHLLASTLQKALKMDPNQARFYTIFHYVIRYMLLFITLFIAIKRPDMGFLWTVAGLLIPKAVIYGGNFVDLYKHRFKLKKNFDNN